jgi:ABC-type branched-subunit amino acid transport system substrate-binding protein
MAPTQSGGSQGSTGGGSAPGGAGSNSNPGGTSSPAGGSDAPPGEPPLAHTEAGSCAGFKNGPGITDESIAIGNAADISGPIPGLFKSSQDAVKAFVAYFNATSDICGRKLTLTTYDSRTDAGADQQAYTAACDEVFATVGSMSAFDSGGAGTAQACGLPDLRTANVTEARANCTTCFGAQGTRSTEWPNAFADFVKDNYGDAAAHAAMVYINAGGAAEAAQNEAHALSKRGLKFDYIQGIDISEFNYSPFVQGMKDHDIEAVFFVGAYQQSVRMRQAMAQSGYEPKVYFRDPTDYNPTYVEQAGDAADGTVVAVNFVPFEEASSSKEMELYLSWLKQANPSATPDFFGVYAWSAARLFVELASGLGGKLTRSTMVEAIGRTNNWTANGLTSPQPVGREHVGDCWRFLRLENGRWSAASPRAYICHGLSVA